MSRDVRDWASRLRLSVSDEPYGSDEPTGGTELNPAAAKPDLPATGSRPAAGGVPLRWCLLSALLALALAAAGGSLVNARRGRTVTSTVVAYRQPHGVGLTGCPRGDVCQPLPQSDAELTDLLPPELAGATLLAGSLLLDSATSRTIRSLQVLTADGLSLLITGQCIAGADSMPARDTEPARSDDGSSELAFVRPGRVPGCSAALLARVPAGHPVPGQWLRQLADELPQRLVNNG